MLFSPSRGRGAGARRLRSRLRRTAVPAQLQDVRLERLRRDPQRHRSLGRLAELSPRPASGVRSPTRTSLPTTRATGSTAPGNYRLRHLDFRGHEPLVRLQRARLVLERVHARRHLDPGRGTAADRRRPLGQVVHPRPVVVERLGLPPNLDRGSGRRRRLRLDRHALHQGSPRRGLPACVRRFTAASPRARARPSPA